VGNIQLDEKKVTYMSLNDETAQSSVINRIAMPTFDQTDKYT